MTNSVGKVVAAIAPIIGAAIRCITYHVSHAPAGHEQKKYHLSVILTGSRNPRHGYSRRARLLWICKSVTKYCRPGRGGRAWAA